MARLLDGRYDYLDSTMVAVAACGLVPQKLSGMDVR